MAAKYFKCTTCKASIIGRPLWQADKPYCVEHYFDARSNYHKKHGVVPVDDAVKHIESTRRLTSAELDSLYRAAYKKASE